MPGRICVRSSSQSPTLVGSSAAMVTACGGFDGEAGSSGKPGIGAGGGGGGSVCGISGVTGAGSVGSGAGEG